MLKLVLDTGERISALPVAQKEGLLKDGGGRKSSPEIQWWWCGRLLRLLPLLLQPRQAAMPWNAFLLGNHSRSAQGKLQIQSKSEPNALSTIKYTGTNDNFSKSLCCYWFSFIGSMQPDLMWEWTRRATNNNPQNLPAVELALQVPDFDQSVSLYDWSVRKF